ncbi:MAG: helix-turn-helix domain-containing protein [Faecousia sp.]
MKLGQRIKQARLEAGLSQRQLCGEEITRNMLSQIENGSAKPSMTTLQYLAARLGKSVSFFLDEDTLASPNQSRMVCARECYAGQDFAGALRLLRQYEEPDEVYDGEKNLLLMLSLTELAARALEEGRRPYAAQLLRDAEAAAKKTLYDTPELRRNRNLLMAKAQPDQAGEILEDLPVDDRELLLRAEAALQGGNPQKATQLLAAARDQSADTWSLLWGRAAMERGEYSQALEYFRRVEEACPDTALPALERCCRELEDYKMAYHYACLQRERK